MIIYYGTNQNRTVLDCNVLIDSGFIQIHCIWHIFLKYHNIIVEKRNFVIFPIS